MQRAAVAQEAAREEEPAGRRGTRERTEGEEAHLPVGSLPPTTSYHDDSINDLTSGSWMPEAIPAHDPYHGLHSSSWLSGDGSAAFYPTLLDAGNIYLPYASQPADTHATAALDDQNLTKSDISLIDQILYPPVVPLDGEVASGSRVSNLDQTPYSAAPPYPLPMSSHLQQQQGAIAETGPHHYNDIQYPMKPFPSVVRPVWPPVTSQPGQQSLVFLNSFSNEDFTPSLGLDLTPREFPRNENVLPVSKDLQWVEPTPLPKRKMASQNTYPPKAAEEPRKNISEFVTVFENSPGALSSVKKRKKLDAPVRKAAKEVRKAGACHQCRFRKRTCSTGTPCGSCLKHVSRLDEVRCQRDSPFVGKLMHKYFEHSSTRRVVSFNVNILLDDLSSSEFDVVSIDGVGRLSHPLNLQARRKVLRSLSDKDQKIIKQTEDPKAVVKESAKPVEVLLLEEGQDFGTQVEQWAVEYTAKFVHAAGPEFRSTTMAQILGLAYVRKGLPEANLVASMLRVAALAFVLRAGVKVNAVNGSSAPRFRTVQARIDTVLYERLKKAEKDLYNRLQALIFRTAGSLNRDQVYPVALVMWQLLRILTIGASHLANLVARFQSTATMPADYQLHGLKLLVSTHLALFRSSSPLLLDFREKFNKKMLGDDEELVKLAMRMRKVVLDFRSKGFPDLKGSIVWNKEYFEMFRRVFDGL